jgi:hypothetical protein
MIPTTYSKPSHGENQDDIETKSMSSKSESKSVFNIPEPEIGKQNETRQKYNYSVS